MRNRKFSLVTAILLLLLIAAIANTYIIFHADDSAIDASAKPDTIPSGVSRHGAPAGSFSATAPPWEFIAFSWYGDVTLVRLKDGRYELEAQAYQRGGRSPFQIDSVEIDIRRPGSDGGFSPKLDPAAVGKFTGRVDFPASGTWEVRVRMHQGVQTLEFGKKFDLD